MSTYTRTKDRKLLLEQMLIHYGLHNVDINYDYHFAARNKIKRKKLKRKHIVKIFYKGKPSEFKSAKRETIYAEYVFDTNTINLNQRELSDDREFLITVLHEINHAMDGKEMGIKNFKESYLKEESFYGYENNKYELKAESWANQELTKWL